jgi:hypothetical protein
MLCVPFGAPVAHMPSRVFKKHLVASCSLPEAPKFPMDYHSPPQPHTVLEDP